jgi:pyrroline-5-carboxylate reductase
MIGLIGSGNMARALARGWGEPLLCTDALAERADELAGEVGGWSVKTNADLAAQADLVVLCHKPAQLEQVAAEIRGAAKGIVSILGGVPLQALKDAYPGVPVVRVIPSVPVEVRQGVTCHARDREADPEFEARVLELFGRVGPVVTLDEGQFEAATGLMSCAPAYMALVAEAQIDAGVRAGVPAELAAQLAVETMAGTAALLRERDFDTLGVRRMVTSPGGITARGLAALEHGGVRGAFDDAMQAVAGR